MPSKKILLIIVIIIFAALGGWFLFLQNESLKNQNSLRASGNIEVTETAVSFKIAGLVERRFVREGQMVKAGEIIARLQSTELEREVALRRAEVAALKAALSELEAGSRQEEIAQAEANYQRIRARLQELLSGARPQEIASAEAEVEQAKAEVSRLREEERRQRVLYEKEIISQREYEMAQTAWQVALARLRQAEERLNLIKEGPRPEEIAQVRAALQEAEERYALIKKGPREETIAQARARLQAAREALAMAETRLGYATLLSPLSGVVLSENVEEGEYVSPGTPVVTIGDLQKVWLRVYINETDLGRIKLGQSVRVTTDTYPNKIYYGRLSFISSQAEFTPKFVQTEKERVKLVYRVKIEIPNPEEELKPGMPAKAEILLHQQK